MQKPRSRHGVLKFLYIYSERPRSQDPPCLSDCEMIISYEVVLYVHDFVSPEG